MTINEQAAPKELTPKHVRAACALLARSQQELAKAAGVATSTVADFERGQRTPGAALFPLHGQAGSVRRSGLARTEPVAILSQRVAR